MQAVLRRHLEGQKNEAIATELGLAEKTVRNLETEAIKLLRVRLSATDFAILDTVILSVVDTVDKGFVGSRQSLSNGLNLLNNAVSRTKRQLIIVCEHKYWKAQSGQLLADLLAVAEVKITMEQHLVLLTV